MVTADAEFIAAATEAEIDMTIDPILKYLRVIRITTSNAISVYFQDDAAVADLVKKIEEKILYTGNDYVLNSEDVNAVIAQWKVLSAEVRKKYNQRLFASTTSSASTTPTPAIAPTTTDKDTVPKIFPSGEYTQLIKDYNNITLDGDKRNFPEKVLLGADKVLARIHHEDPVSKYYTAMTLGEIMSERSFASLGTVKSNRKKDDLDIRLIVDNK